MRWDSSPSGGFTGDGVQPWLPYGNAAEGSVADQQADPSSILHLCRDLLALRRKEFAGQLASYEQLPAPAGVWVYETGGLTVAANFSDEPATLDARARRGAARDRRGGAGRSGAAALGRGDRPLARLSCAPG